MTTTKAFLLIMFILVLSPLISSITWTGGTMVEKGSYLKLDASNDPLTSDLEINKGSGDNVDFTMGIDTDTGIIKYIKNLDSFWITDIVALIVPQLVSFGNITTTEALVGNWSGGTVYGDVVMNDNLITMYSPNGTEWECGVTNAGSFVCS